MVEDEVRIESILHNGKVFIRTPVSIDFEEIPIDPPVILQVSADLPEE